MCDELAELHDNSQVNLDTQGDFKGLKQVIVDYVYYNKENSLTVIKFLIVRS